MGNALKVSDSIVDICYGLRNPLLPHIYLQPIISEFDLNKIYISSKNQILAIPIISANTPAAVTLAPAPYP